MFILQTDIPVCNVNIKYEQYLENLYDENNNYMSPKKMLEEFVGSDCWAIEVKYSDIENSVIEYNNYVLEGNFIMNTQHSDYVNTPNKFKGDQFRDFILEFPEEFLKKIDWVEIYMFGQSTPWKMVMEKIHDDKYQYRFYGSEGYCNRWPEEIDLW